MYNQTKEFKELQKKWYKKLKDSGFVEIEKGEDYLITPTSSKFAPSRNKVGSISGVVERMRNTEEYYRLAGHFLHDFNFKTPLDKRIWTLHSEGTSQRNIIVALKKDKIKISKFDMWEIIKKLREEMVKMYGATTK